jgi:hypothetical protein
MPRLHSGSASKKRSFPRWQPPNVPQCPFHGDMEPMGANWRCKVKGCHRVAAGAVPAPISESFRAKELHRGGGGRYAEVE